MEKHHLVYVIAISVMLLVIVGLLLALFYVNHRNVILPSNTIF